MISGNVQHPRKSNFILRHALKLTSFFFLTSGTALQNCVISGFSLDVAENWAVFGFFNPEEGTDRLSRYVGKQLPLLAASEHRKA